VMVLRPEPGQTIDGATGAELVLRNQKLLPYKRLSGYVVWEEDFPRTASLKIKRGVLAAQIREKLQRDSVAAL
jgi:hypothetical protein